MSDAAAFAEARTHHNPEISVMRLLCISGLMLSCVGASISAAEREPELKTLQPGVALTLVGEHPGLATPTGIDVDAQGRIWVVATHTHFRPEDYIGPEHDEVLIFSDPDDDSRVEQRQLFYNATDATMDLELGPRGWVYLAERDRILRIRDEDGDGTADVEEDVVALETEAVYPHNGLEGLAWHPNGDLVFGLGENFAQPWTLTGTDGSTLSGTGEGGIFRCSATGGKLQRIARGLWNPFGICVRADGQIFATDNDPGERPPCRLLHVVEGGDYGYQRAYGSEAHHPFVAWNGELRGTLPMIHPSGEAPCGVTPLGRGLIVPSWSDHRIDWFRLHSRGASYQADRTALLTGGRYFRPGCIARDPNAIGTTRVWYLTDWVDGRYQAHGFGRLWKLTIDLSAAGWVGPLDQAPETQPARRARTLRSAPADSTAEDLLRMANDADPFLATAALESLATRTPQWKYDEFAGWPAADRTIAVVVLRRADANPEPWIGKLLLDSDPDVQFETLRWISDANLKPYVPEVQQYLARADLDYVRFEAALACWNTLHGKPEAGIRDPDLLLARVQDDALHPRLRAYALRLLPAPSLRFSADGRSPTRTFPDGITPERLEPLLMLNHQPLTLEVIRTLAFDLSTGAEIIARVAADPLRSELVRTTATAALAAVAAEHLDLLLRLADGASRSLREESLRCLRALELSKTTLGRLEQLASQYPESSDAFRAILHPETLSSGRPPNGDSLAWLKALDAVVLPPDLEAGRRIFHQTQLARCANCHRYRGRGNVVGPDLSNVSRGLDREKLLQSILEPSRQMAPEYQPRTIVLKDGLTITGIRLRSSTSEVLRDVNGQNRSFNRDEIESMVESTTSFMPAGLANLLTIRELRDLLAFLQDADNPS
ncbi:MAG: PVC-type heme-binding CxxCH protein [Planctomycetaceae bacterium]